MSRSRVSQAGVVAVVVATTIAALAVFLPHLRSRLITSGTPVPQAVAQLSDYTVPAHTEDCLDQVAVEPGSQLALFYVETPGGQPSTALRLTIKGTSFSRVADVPAGRPPGFIVVPFEGPRTAELATVCIRNLGGSDILLRGTNEPRTLSRPRLTIGGTPTAGEFSLAFQTANGKSTFSLASTIANRISAFKPAWVQPWLVIALLALVLVGAFVVPWYALWRSFVLDEP